MSGVSDVQANLTVPSKPNILVIFVRPRTNSTALGCVGNTAVRTPNLARLADEGVIFRDCNTNSPLSYAGTRLVDDRSLRP